MVARARLRRDVRRDVRRLIRDRDLDVDNNFEAEGGGGLTTVIEVSAQTRIIWCRAKASVASTDYTRLDRPPEDPARVEY
jgi:hypothetical protein